MNTFAIVILVALVGEYLLGAVTGLLSARSFSPAVPAEFAGVFDDEKYARARRYTATRTRFGLARGAFDLAVVLAFWFAGGFAWLDTWARGLGQGPVVTGLAFIGAIALASTVLGLPFRAWSTFVIEARYGFNRTTAGTFVADLLKGTALTVVLGGLLLAVILAFFEWAGPLAWLWCWMAATAFVLAVQFIAPTWIMPLFNTFTPPRRRRAARRHPRLRPLREVPPRGHLRRRRLAALVQGQRLLHRLRQAQAHRALRHPSSTSTPSPSSSRSWRTRSATTRSGTSGCRWPCPSATSGRCCGSCRSSSGRRACSRRSTSPSPRSTRGCSSSACSSPRSSSCCRSSCRSSRAATSSRPTASRPRPPAAGAPLVSALKKLSADNLSNLTPHPLDVFLHYSHPPVAAPHRRPAAG